ncbi:hypothetical protein RO21_04215 [[Actinobacillus] muris]|uniref:Uncharacterized protein n=1 Tax=Muribacter muris TaxID=67855 RepID=A0A0J5S4P0_9PAST|nr:hypothetical protein RO21_04215 [[Actinobacillus] muris] [Muribacter muris]
MNSKKPFASAQMQAVFFQTKFAKEIKPSNIGSTKYLKKCVKYAEFIVKPINSSVPQFFMYLE